MCRWRGVCLLQIYLPWGTVPRILQIMENEVCQEHQNHKTLSCSPRKFVHCCAFNHPFAHFLKEGCFYSRTFEENSRAELLEGWFALTNVKYHDNLLILMLLNQWLALTMFQTNGPSGPFKNIAQFFIFQGRFKNTMLFKDFSRPVRTMLK